MRAEKRSADSLEPGMVLAADVNLPDGSVLLSAGTELSARHCALLVRRGVAEVSVRLDSPGTDADALVDAAVSAGRNASGDAGDATANVRARLDHIFEEVRGEPLMDRLYGLACERAARLRVDD